MHEQLHSVAVGDEGLVSRVDASVDDQHWGDHHHYHPQQSDLNPHAEQRQTACMRYTSPPHRSQTTFSSFEAAVLLGCAINPVFSGVIGLIGFGSVIVA